MITLFRKIRQQLLSESKFSKYVLYAFGEIVLVVIGILIALKLNNWNAQRKSDELLQVYKTNIMNELEQDLVELKTADSLIDVRMRSIEDYIAYSQLDSKSMDVLVNKRDSTQLYYVRFQSNTLSLQDLMSTGNLQLFDMEEKRSILNYQYALNEFKELQALGMELASHKYNEFEHVIDKLALHVDAENNQTTVAWKYDLNSEAVRRQNNYIMTFLEYFELAQVYLNRLHDRTEGLKRVLGE